MLIVNDKNIDDTRTEVLKLIKKVKELQPKYYRKILKGSIFLYIKLFKGRGVPFIIKHGIKIYSMFNKNILAE